MASFPYTWQIKVKEFSNSFELKMKHVAGLKYSRFISHLRNIYTMIHVFNLYLMMNQLLNKIKYYETISKSKLRETTVISLLIFFSFENLALFCMDGCFRMREKPFKTLVKTSEKFYHRFGILKSPIKSCLKYRILSIVCFLLEALTILLFILFCFGSKYAFLAYNTIALSSFMWMIFWHYKKTLDLVYALLEKVYLYISKTPPSKLQKNEIRDSFKHLTAVKNLEKVAGLHFNKLIVIIFGNATATIINLFYISTSLSLPFWYTVIPPVTYTATRFVLLLLFVNLPTNLINLKRELCDELFKMTGKPRKFEQKQEVRQNLKLVRMFNSILKSCSD
ncbi:UNVERIFIED_CONTAM: hypothetical protein RMT77_010392 [Armadillidium vulgare]